MKKKLITYGVRGMMEYRVSIPVGRSKVDITFSGGGVTACGKVPATYTTSSLMIQDSIERSVYFTKGYITKERVIELDEEIATTEKPTVTKNTAANQSAAADKETEIISSKSEAEDSDGNKKTFACNDDAKDWLEENFNAPRSKMLTRKDIIAIGLTNGIKIEFI